MASFFTRISDSCKSSCSAAYTSCTPGNNDAPISCCDMQWRKEQLRVIICCIVTIIFLGLLFGDFAKTAGILGCSIVASVLCCKAYNWLNQLRQNGTPGDIPLASVAVRPNVIPQGQIVLPASAPNANMAAGSNAGDVFLVAAGDGKRDY